MRKVKWNQITIATRRDFHDDFGRILDILQESIKEKFIIHLFQPDKAILKRKNEELALTLAKYRGWVTLGPITLKMKDGTTKLHGSIRVVPHTEVG